MKIVNLLTIILFMTMLRAYGQQEFDQHDIHHLKNHRLALFTGYGLTSGLVNSVGKNQVKIIPVFGIGYSKSFGVTIGKRLG